MPSKESPEVAESIHALWNYMRLGQEPEGPVDFLWIFGSHDLRTADRAAELFHAGLAPIIVTSGGFGRSTEGVFAEPEAVLLQKRAVRAGVPEEQILVEPEATNTGENTSFTRALLERRGLPCASAIAVQKPFMERRIRNTAAKVWPELNLQVTSPQMGFEEYCADIDREEIIELMVGDYQRIVDYPARGFMVEDTQPAAVDAAWQTLVDAGYDTGLLN